MIQLYIFRFQKIPKIKVFKPILYLIYIKKIISKKDLIWAYSEKKTKKRK